MTTKNNILILGVFLLASCKNNQNGTATLDTNSKAVVVLTDSSKAKLADALEGIITSNSSPDDISINAKFIDQGRDSKRGSWLTIKTENDSIVTLINPMALNETDIAKLKKDGNNITLTYTASDKTVKFLMANYEPEK